MFLFSMLLFAGYRGIAQTDNIVLKDFALNKENPAGMLELSIPSAGNSLSALMYTANGKDKHPTLILAHGLPGNERNLDVAQLVRARGWNVLYFNYRGSWGSSGVFGFENCVEDLVNAVAYCNRYQDSLKIDTSRIVLLGHSMGAWASLRAMEKLPQVKKVFALSTANFFVNLKTVSTEQQFVTLGKEHPEYFESYPMLTTKTFDILFTAWKHLNFFDLTAIPASYKGKQIIMLDEDQRNKELANSVKNSGPLFFDYQVWDTDHSFSNKRASLANKVIEFLEK
jgi:pimeloyl-ACP methyl ester carboxylesterase